MYKLRVADRLPSYDEKLLLSKISKGDEVAFRMVFDYHRKRVYSYALKVVKSESQAEEILHDVFMKIWQHESADEIESLEFYLRTLTKHITFKLLRRMKLEVRVNEELSHSWTENHNETEDRIISNDTERILTEAINLLPPQQKMVYTLCKDEGLQYAQVAEKLSISPLTVKTHMQHALRFLRNYVINNTDVSMFIILMQIISEKK